jgi:ABC-type multidrug transport system ATPase subunit/pSer/pThr/pTyr-binding forkhead associated (FHA) protein
LNTGETSPNSSSIRFATGPLKGRVFPTDKGTITFGSDVSNDIVIKDDPKVAPFHARLVWQESYWHIERHPQAGPINVNAQQVDRATLHDGALVALGENTSFVLFVPTETQDLRSEGKQAALTAVATPSDASTQRMVKSMQQPDQTVIAPFSALGLSSLEVSSNTSDEKRMYALDKQVMSIGRNITNDIVINSRTVSGQHIQTVRQGNQWVLFHPHPERKQTLNGLLYQGRKIRGDEHFRKVLVPGDIFRIGNEDGSFVTLTYHDGSSETQDELPPMHPIKLVDAEVTIGRVTGNTVVLPHPQVSAHHARLVREGGSYRIFDQNSTNHIYVNAQLVTNALLKMGDEIRIGPYKLIFESTQLTQYDESNYIRIDALNLKKYGNNHVTLLNNISLSIAPRKFVAVVGGSGAGKSMLLNALSGLRPAQEGKVLYNGQDYYRNLAAFNTQLGYVPQDDIVHRDLTLERALFYAARMRLPNDFTEEQIQQRIDEVLEDVEMTGRRKLLIKKLSGGQRKRASIAMELLANPSLFFLDEPTSGLDPGLDRKMMFLLRKLADKGHTIILVTHATNNISTCDYVCFLAQEGRLAYFGPPEEAKAFFGKDNFAEIYSSVEPSEGNSNVPEEVEVRFKSSKDYQAYIAEPLKGVHDVTSRAPSGINGRARSKEKKRPKRGNPWKLFVLLCMRHVELLKNDPGNLLILLLQAPLVALLLMLMVRFEIGGGIFDPNSIVQCRTQILTSSGPLALPGISNVADLVDCKQVVNFLTTDPNGTSYAQAKGGTNKALQDFIVPAESGDAQRVIFLVGFFAILFGCINGTREIVKEAAIYQRERAVNLGILPYMFSKITVLGALAFVQAASILFIVDAFEPYHQGVFLPVLLEIYVTLALASVAGVMMGLVVSAGAPNDDIANSLLSIIIVPQVIFAGSIIPLKDWFTQIVSAITPSRWALAALGTSLGLHADKIDGGKLFGNDYTYHGTLFSIYSKDDGTQRIVLAWIALSVIILALTCIIGIFLKRKDARE